MGWTAKILNDGVRLEKVSVAFEEGAKKVLENINLTFDGERLSR